MHDTTGFQFTWNRTGIAVTRRVQELYLRAVLRQDMCVFSDLPDPQDMVNIIVTLNSAYFDRVGAGEIATRIQSDTYLFQEGVSDKIPITYVLRTLSQRHLDNEQV
jgi:ATP-binding cassette subfamily B (MDR/TAP) protein 1